MHIAQCKILPCRLRLRSSATFNHEKLHRHTQCRSPHGGSHWLAVHFRHKSSYADYFDSYGIVPFVPDIVDFVQQNCTTWDRNKGQLESLTSDVFGKYCCLFALYMDRGYNPHQFVALFGTPADRQVEEMITAEFAAKMPRSGWCQCCRSCL